MGREMSPSFIPVAACKCKCTLHSAVVSQIEMIVAAATSHRQKRCMPREHDERNNISNNRWSVERHSTGDVLSAQCSLLPRTHPWLFRSKEEGTKAGPLSLPFCNRRCRRLPRVPNISHERKATNMNP